MAAALPEASMVGDRFHVAVQYQKAGDELRKTECRWINADGLVDQGIPTAELRRVLHQEGPFLNPAQ